MSKDSEFYNCSIFQHTPAWLSSGKSGSGLGNWCVLTPKLGTLNSVMQWLGPEQYKEWFEKSVQYSNPCFTLKWQLCGIPWYTLSPMLGKINGTGSPAVLNSSTRHSSSWMDTIVPLSSSVVGFTCGGQRSFVKNPSHTIQRTVHVFAAGLDSSLF